MSRKYTASEAGHRPDRRWEMVDSFVLNMERIEDTGLDCTSFCYLLACFHLCGYFLVFKQGKR